jgi:hypothetical protein
MDQYDPGGALAAERIAELHRQADRRRLASRIPGRTHVGTGTARHGRHGSSGDMATPPPARAVAASQRRPLPAVQGEEPRREPC